MDLSRQSEAFSFGEVADTEYVSYAIVDTEHKLPYHPFHFDLTLTVLKSKSNYEEPGTEFSLSRDMTIVFGRKKKVQGEWTEYKSLPRFLNAEIISGKHFCINQNYVIKDLGSKNGTFLWIDRSNPKKLQINDTFLIAKQPLVITKVIHLPKATLEMTYQGELIKISDQKKMFLIGSHQKCDLVIPSLQHFQVCINVTFFTIFTHLEEEQAEMEHGLWYKLRPEKKEEIVLEHGNLVLADPYIFRVTS